MFEVKSEKVESDKYDTETDMGRKQATSTRNLRLREDCEIYHVGWLIPTRFQPRSRFDLIRSYTVAAAKSSYARHGRTTKHIVTTTL